MSKKKLVSKRPVAVDLFAGAGGLSLAALQSGFSIDFAVENDIHSVETYRNNICRQLGGKGAVVFENSILEYNPSKIQADRFRKQSCDLLLGGPPCQGFSTHRILDAGVNDPRNELLLAYFDFVKALTPRIFLMENVPGILWERHRRHLDKLYKEGKKAGYSLYPPVVLDARDYGVPQRRKRVFVLGLRGDVDAKEFIWPPEPSHCEQRISRSRLKPWVSCASVFEAAPSEDINDIHMNHGQDLLEAFKKTPINGGSRKESGRVLPCHEKHDGHKDVYGRIDPSQPAPTMTTACINPSKGRFVHPSEHHGITVRQAARIQTFPDIFIFSGGLTAAGRQIGNAVPIELGKFLIKYIKTNLIDLKIKKATCQSFTGRHVENVNSR